MSASLLRVGLGSVEDVADLARSLDAVRGRKRVIEVRSLQSDIAGDGGFVQNDQPVAVVDSATLGVGVVVGDGARRKRQLPGIVDAAAVIGGRVIGDRA